MGIYYDQLTEEERKRVIKVFLDLLRMDNDGREYILLSRLTNVQNGLIMIESWQTEKDLYKIIEKQFTTYIRDCMIMLATLEMGSVWPHLTDYCNVGTVSMTTALAILTSQVDNARAKAPIEETVLMAILQQGIVSMAIMQHGFVEIKKKKIDA
jgi:hypothetical protein